MRKKLFICFIAIIMSQLALAQSAYTPDANGKISQVFVCNGMATEVYDKVYMAMNANESLAEKSKVSPSLIEFSGDLTKDLNDDNTVRLSYILYVQIKDGKYRISSVISSLSNGYWGEMGWLPSKRYSLTQFKASYPSLYNNYIKEVSEIIDSIHKGVDSWTDF